MKDDTYYRYSVDEWQHYENDALPKTTAIASQLNQELTALLESDDSLDGDEVRQKIYDTFADALESLRKDNTFSSKLFLVVWPREEEIINRTAARLNTAEVYEVFETEFGI